ncbi:MAG: mandelate racemase/muconate lactonizing enzyme family protein [Methylobacteriaceae bacterium]|nr:mandelate racemase/muconate lactonizing enzyme family protein [Methylobacteriaceae bacterium]MBV9633297.1 mandelate racemase/muconate lactonizing enzyme family protein [Methylobacteriaceae bacterium]MBV9702847.1 mandelate racemase/muconate lactonizing enzyme family protein [Methylobacteriaceae bacterium]
MKIARIEWFRLDPKVEKEAWVEDEYVWPSQLPCFIVKVSAGDGTYGIGEATSQVWYLGETAEQMESYFRLFDEALGGKDPSNFALAHQAMEATVGGGMPGGRGARSGVDMALYDLVGKARGMPVHALLGGAYRTSFELLTNLYHKTPEEMARACKEFVGRGFKGLKVKVGDVVLAKGWDRDNLESELAKLEAALEVVPKDVYIDADANQGWRSAKWTVSVLRRFETYDNLSIEQPLPYADLEGAAFVRAHAKVPIIMDESVWSPQAMMHLIRMGAADRIVLKLNRVGGFFPAHEIITMCEAAGIGVSVDTNPYTLLGDTAVCHIAAVARTPYPVDCEGHVSFLSLGDVSPYVGGITIKEGRGSLPDAPGLGIDIDWKKLEALTRR